MTGMPGRYRIALGAGWVLLAAAGLIYAGIKSIPFTTALPLLAAFLVEFSFYLLPGFPELWRAWVARMGRLGTVAFLAVSSVIPYLIYSLPAGRFDARNLAQLAAIALVVGLIYVRGRVNGVRDALFIVLLAAFVLYRFFDRIYLSPIPKLQISILGHLMLIRTAALAIFGLRGGVTARFWFLPSAAEWGTGLKWFAFSLLPLAVAGWASGAIRLRDKPLNPLTAVATFAGILWVVALSEEFFFRGLIQQWLEDRMSSGYAALIAASLLFGSVHLGFHGMFPNWRFSLVAAVLGVFCGLAWRERRSIQASMVTHALAATAFRVFFQ
jgi:membrane protease YdiL (CAAX protease family)